jgi:ATP-dependent Clp protease ATP-binding subunit ClpA
VFEKFEPAARQAFLDARMVARQTGQDKVRSEHLLFGLLSEPGLAAEAMAAAGVDLTSLRERLGAPAGDGSAAMDADALALLGIDLDAVRRATDAAFGRGALDLVAVPGRDRLGVTDDTRRSLSGALRQAQRLGSRQISSGHVLFAVLDQKSNGALDLLAGMGTDTAALRADVLRRITAAA